MKQPIDCNQIFFIGHNKYGQAGTGQQQHNQKYPLPKQIVFKTFIKQVSCGNHHSALLTIDSLIYTMGSNIHGTLGLGNGVNINYAFKPTLVKDIKDVDQIVSGSYHMCAIKQGELYSWGKGIDGQLGHGNMKNLFTPTKVQTLGNEVEFVSCGLNHTLVIVNSRTENNQNGYAFGNGIYGQLGYGMNRSSNHPVNIKLVNIQAISAGENHSLLIAGGRIYGCGDNSYMQLVQLQQSLKSKKYFLQPVQLRITQSSQQHQQITLIDCHNLSACMTHNNTKLLIWGGKHRIYPPLQFNQPQSILNFKLSNQKIYYINSKNQLISLTFPQQNPTNPIKQILLQNNNVLDLNCGENHLLVVGDIVAQTQDKLNSEHLSIWAGESLTASKKSFTLSQKNINKNSQITNTLPTELKVPISQEMSDFYFTMHLKSGISEDIKQHTLSQKLSQQNLKSLTESQSAKQQDYSSQAHQNSNETFKTFENISSSIEMQSRFPHDVNYSDPKNCFNEQQGIVKIKQIPSIDRQSKQILSVDTVQLPHQNKFTQADDTKQFSQMKLQRLMQEMEQKTIHLKKNYPLLNNGGLRYQKSITKTPSSYIKKQPEKFVIGSEQYNEGNYSYHDPKISQFDQKIPVNLIFQQRGLPNLQKNSYQYKEIMKKRYSKQSISASSLHENDNNLPQQLITQQTHEAGLIRKNKANQNKEQQNIQTIFIQLLRKQKEKTSQKNLLSETNKIKQLIDKDDNQLPQRRKRLSHSCISEKKTQTSISRAKRQQPQLAQQNSQLVVTRSPNLNENKLAVSKISQHSNISSKTNFKKNTELLEISRSNRQLRYELRDRDLKISQLQQELSKKQVQMQMLYAQVQYFRNVPLNCQKCGNSVQFEDPFFSN